MAPSNMFSYLRPGHAKRHAASVASPDVVSPAAHPLPSPSQTTEYFTSPRIPDNASFQSNSPVSPFPPQLPPIPRVASRMDKLASGSNSASHSASHSAMSAMSPTSHTSTMSPVSPPPSLSQPPSTAGGGSDGQLSPSYDARRPSRPATASPQLGPRSQSLAQVVENALHLTPSSLSPNYSTNSRSQTSLISGFSEKLSSNSTPRHSSTPTAAPQKATKSRLSLRNPMSLLMRRRSGQILDPLLDEALVSHRSPSIVPPLPDNYDPSIRGRIVHDFSAPRPNRNFSYSNAYGGSQVKPVPSTEPDRPSPPKIEKEHAPVFREHFDDDTSYEQSQAAIHRESLANRDFIARNSFPPPPGRTPPPLPPSQDLLTVPSPQQVMAPQPSPEPEQPLVFEASVLSPVQEAPSPTDAPVEETPRKRKSTKTPPTSRSRATSVNDPSFTPAGLPTHLTSRASRFSFQIGNGDSAAQEKILEERHKQKAAERASKEGPLSPNSFDDEYDEYGMDDYDMDAGGLEEEIPMLGDEDEYSGLGDQSLSPGMAAFDFSSLAVPSINNVLSSMSMNAEASTPRDVNGNPIGFAMSEEMLQKMQPVAPGQQLVDGRVPTNGPQRLSLVTSQPGQADPAVITPAEPRNTEAAPPSKPSAGQVQLDDDLYFDDGLIAEQGEADNGAVKFDESVFDDPAGPLFDRKMKPPTAEEFRSPLSSHPVDFLGLDADYDADDDALSKHLKRSVPSLAHKPSMADHRPLPDFSNLEAYHSALAEAANRAEADGRFYREASVDAGKSSFDVDDDSTRSNSRPSLVPDDGRFSQETTGLLPDDDGFGMDSSFMDDYDYDYSDYDSALENDPMIAAANAEALANDDDGFYGQEFGFYASSEQGGNASAYGGFFGSSGIGRTVSGRNAVREPNLTPITERSEYSTRNSFISLNHFRDGQTPIVSPGLAQLRGISPFGWREDEDLSLDALVKLRKGAFGSTLSLPGSGAPSPRAASPMRLQFIPRSTSPAWNRMVEQNGSSIEESDESGGGADGFEGEDDEDEALMEAVNAVPEEDEDEDDSDNGNTRPESPTLTASDYNALSSPIGYPPNADVPTMSHAQLMQSPSAVPLPMSPPALPLKSPPPLTVHTAFQPPPPPQSIDTSFSSPSATNSSAPRTQSLGLISPISTTSPMTPSGTGWKAGHSRKGSAADSVAYVREHDELGGDRWVLERRRTAESGELELVGREIVEGGRI